jgi:adenosylcobinamide-GDP ribazoletransferase
MIRTVHVWRNDGEGRVARVRRGGRSGSAGGCAGAELLVSRARMAESHDERRAALDRSSAANTPDALLRQCATAVRFLTVVPLPGKPVPLGQSALFFPLVGLGLGASLLAADAVLAPVVPGLVRSLLVVALLASVTGGVHLRGLVEAIEDVRVSRQEDSRASTRATSAGAFGMVVLVLVLLLKVWSLDVLPVETHTAALLIAPMLARWAIVVLAFGSLPARTEGLGFAMVKSLTFREFGVATVLALWVTLAGTAARGLAAALLVACVTIGCRILVHRRLGGVTGGAMGAVAEVSEALVLAVFAVGAPPGVALA